MLTFNNTPDIFVFPNILGVFMEEKEIIDRTTKIYSGADQIIAYCMNDLDLDIELTALALGAAYANVGYNTNISMHDAVDLFVTFYKQMVQKGEAH